ALQAAALRLRLHLGDVDAQHLDAEELLDRLPDLRLVRVRVDAERVGVAALDLRIALLRHDRSEQDFIRMQAHQVAFSCTRSSASCVTRTERAQTSAETSSLSGVVTTTRSMLRNDLETFCSSPVTTTTGSSCPQAARTSTALRVDGSEKLAPSSTPKVPSAACCERTPRKAERRALDQQQVFLGSDLMDDQAHLRDALPAHPAGHLDPLEHPRGRRRRADRARLADVVRAVRLRPSVEAVPLDRAREALPVRDAGHLDLLARLEGLDGDVLAHDELALTPQLEQAPEGTLDVVLLQVSQLGLGHLALRGL